MVALTFAELRDYSGLEISVRAVDWPEPVILPEGSWRWSDRFGGCIEAPGRFVLTRAEVMEAYSPVWRPCGPGCACNDLTMVCWGPING